MSRRRLVRSMQRRLAEGVTLLAGPAHPYSLPHQRYDPFFIIGSGRCGTTLLRRVLQVSPDIHIPPETYMIGEAAEIFRECGAMGWSRLVRLTLASFEYHEEFGVWETGLRDLAQQLVHAPRGERSLAHILDALFRHHATIKGRTPVRWGDKTPVNYRHTADILRIFPDARFVHLIRDGVDVVQSILKAGMRSDVAGAAERWLEGTTMAHAFCVAHPAITLEVRYEDLVRDPATHARRVCDFLGIAFLPGMIESGDAGDAVRDVLGWEHHANVLKPISTGSVGKGRRDMSEPDRRTLQQLIGRELAAFGYEPAV